MDRKPRPIIGLAENAKGVNFRCGTCEYFDGNKCHNKDKQLHLRPVKADWCCDLYEHPGMRVIVK